MSNLDWIGSINSFINYYSILNYIKVILIFDSITKNSINYYSIHNYVMVILIFDSTALNFQQTYSNKLVDFFISIFPIKDLIQKFPTIPINPEEPSLTIISAIESLITIFTFFAHLKE